MTRSFTMAIVLAASPLCVAAAPTNLLINPGAESGDTSGWSVASDAFGMAAIKRASPVPPRLIGDVTPFEGEYFFSPTGEAFPPDRGGVKFSQYVDLPTSAAGQQATLSFWGTMGQGIFSDYVVGGVQFFDAAGLPLGWSSTPDDMTSGAQWAERKASSLVPQGATRAEVGLYFSLKGGSELDAYADKVSFTVSAVPEADAMALAAAGLAVAGMVGVTRRRGGSA